VIVLVDTHALLWALLDPDRLSPVARDALRDPANRVLVSAATAWEIAIKVSLGKLTLPGPPESWLEPAVAAIGFEWLPVTPRDALAVRALPWVHRDPFDRLLIAQAARGVKVVTADPRFAEYGVAVVW
jgi:PIN domain nuclease of toxin-antitoxin system